MNNRTGVLILTASNFSAYTLAVLQLLRNEDVEIRGVVIRKLVDRSRIIRELKSSGFSVLSKVFKKLVLQRLGIGQKFQDGFSEYYRRIGCEYKSVTAFCEQHDVKFELTTDFHEPETLSFIESCEPGLVVFTGGGLVRQTLIDRAGAGVLNCHMGILPKYRGMDCTYWCALENDLDNIGFTAHLMDSGVDTGPILDVHRVRAADFSGLDEIIFEIERRMAPATAAAACKILRREAQFRPQRMEDGRQYYTIGPECRALAHKLFHLNDPGSR
jgi:folate-dependent phosphoribosylglycinamide formyltransferase PurN